MEELMNQAKVQEYSNIPIQQVDFKRLKTDFITAEDNQSRVSLISTSQLSNLTNRVPVRKQRKIVA